MAFTNAAHVLEGQHFLSESKRMTLAQLFRSYQLLLDKADGAFNQMVSLRGNSIKCGRHCSDCCHAVFGLFLIEAAFLKQRFDELDKKLIHEALLRCNETERSLRRLEVKFRNYEDDPAMQALLLAQERVRCPLLSESEECILYSSRPITCRVYGIPTRIQGKPRVCWKSGFKNGESYPLFDLDSAYQGLFELSKAFLSQQGNEDPERASLLFSLPKVLIAPVESLIKGDLG